MAKITYLPGEVANAAVDENGNRLPVTRTQHIFDDTMNKPQSQVNEETAEAISDEVTRAQNAESGLDTRLQTVEELAEISVGGGDIGIGTAADFESDDPSDLAKVPTVSAILGGANDGVYDISARHNGTKYADLEAALGTNGINVPVGVRRGGMSVKFVQSSDNKYIQAICMAQNFTTDVTQWQSVDEIPTAGSNNLVKSGGVTKIYGKKVKANEFIRIITDNNNKILWAIKEDGTIFYGAGIPPQIQSKIEELVSQSEEDIKNIYGELKSSNEWLRVYVDENDKIIFGIRKDGTISNPTTDIIPQIDVRVSKLENQSSITQHITVKNSDKILIVGDSYTESSYSVVGKSYIEKLSLFSDFQFANYGKSGDVYIGRMYDTRRDIASYGCSFEQYNPKYVMLCCFTNDIKYMSFDKYLVCLQNAITFFRGLGCEPIVCTEYHTLSSTPIRAAMENVANKNGCMFFDIASYCDVLIGYRKYEPFWGGSHPGTRTNAIESDSYEKCLSSLELPLQSIKLFRARSSYSTLDELLFKNNYEKAKIFKEIIVGSYSLRNASDVDTNPNDAVLSTSEYGKLIKGQSVNFNQVALISCTLPALGRDISYLSLKVVADEDITVYRKSTKASPYPIPVRLANFYISPLTIPSSGSIYRCEEDNEEYTVVEYMVDDFGQGHLLCSGSLTVSATEGTLVKVSGVGDSSIGYTYREVGYTNNVINNDTCGHWVEVPADSDGLFDITDNIDDSVDQDKVHFLVISSGTFNISDVDIAYKASLQKQLTRKKNWRFDSNIYNTSVQELLPSDHFGTAGQEDTNWNITPELTYEQQQSPSKNVIPLGFTSIYKVTDVKKLSCSVTPIKTGYATLEIWCRYFPDIYTDGSGNQITENSFDYNEIKVNFNNVVLSERVNTHWKQITFDILLKEGVALPIDIFSNSDGIEVAYMSLKYNI